MNLNDLVSKATDATQGNDSAEGETSGGISNLMDMAKDFDMAELERYKNMPKMELLEELKNSEHSETVVNFIKDLIAKKGD